jgi:small conductance mechanosensitive channel
MDLNAMLTSLIVSLQSVAWKIIGALTVLIVGNIIIKFIIKKIKNGKLSQKFEPTVHNFLISFIKISLYVLLVVSVVAILGVPMASIVAVIGTIGVAISLAVQGTLGNLASGLMLLVFKHFKDGDYIECEGNGGTVVDIGIFYTTLKTPDNKIIEIPNSSLTGSSIINYSKEATRRLDISIGVAYGTDIELAKKTTLDVISKHENILKEPSAFVRLTEINNTGITLTLRVWCASADYWNLKFNLLEEIYESFGKIGIKLPFTKLSVNIEEKSKLPDKNQEDIK